MSKMITFSLPSVEYYLALAGTAGINKYLPQMINTYLHNKYVFLGELFARSSMETVQFYEAELQL